MDKSFIFFIYLCKLINKKLNNFIFQLNCDKKIEHLQVKTSKQCKQGTVTKTYSIQAISHWCNLYGKISYKKSDSCMTFRITLVKDLVKKNETE